MARISSRPRRIAPRAKQTPRDDRRYYDTREEAEAAQSRASSYRSKTVIDIKFNQEKGKYYLEVASPRR
jgi:hypothetical protein